MIRSSLILILLLLARYAGAQEKPLDMKMDFEEYDPPSSLVVKEHKLTRAKFPFIDIHNHYGNMNTADLNERVKFMDELNMAVMVNLSGRGFRSNGDHLAKSMENIGKQFPNRFVLFTNVDFSDIDNPEWSARTVRQLEEDVKRGARGLKIYKSLGIHNKDKNGQRITKGGIEGVKLIDYSRAIPDAPVHRRSAGPRDPRVLAPLRRLTIAAERRGERDEREPGERVGADRKSVV